MAIAGGDITAILLNAGQGSRLLPLTETIPKCLVEVDGRTILDHQLAALSEAGVARAVVVGGYRIDQIATHLAQQPEPIATELLLNPFWAVAGAIGSAWAARDRLAQPFVLMNGDTVFDAKVLARALDDAPAGVSLLVEPLGGPALDDMLVEVRDGEVRAVDKALPPAHATHRSLGVILSGGGTAYADALAAVIVQDVHAYHHRVVSHLAASGNVRAVIAAGDAAWQEVDRPEDIAAWTRGHRGAVLPS